MKTKTHSPTPPRKKGPKVPKGWRRLRVGTKRPPGYRWQYRGSRGWKKGNFMRYGQIISKSETEFMEGIIYIGPTIRRQPRQPRKSP